MSSSGYPSTRVNGGVLAMSIVATLLCCMPFGIVAIVYAARGENDKAKSWTTAAVVTGLIAIGIGLIATFVND